MKATDELFQLIHSLSPAEKWHFKWNTGKNPRERQKNYIRLFDYVDKQQVYNEPAVLRKFQNDNLGKYLSANKNYLYNMILESLEAFHGKESANQKLHSLQMRIEILFHRRMYKQAWKLLQKAQKMATDYQLEISELKLLQIEQQLLQVLLPPQKLDKKLQSLEEQENQIVSNFQLTSSYVRLMRRLNLLINQFGVVRNERDAQRLSPIFEHPLMRSMPLNASVRAQMLFNIIKADHHLMQDNNNAAWKCYLNVIELSEKNPDQVAINKTLYLANHVVYLYNFLQVATTMHRFDDIYRQKMDSLQRLMSEQVAAVTPADNVKARVFLIYYFIKLSELTEVRKFEAALDLVPEIEQGITKYKPSPQEAMYGNLLFVISLCYFYAGKFSEALEWFERIQNTSEISSQQHIISWVKILTVITHFELGNERVLEYSMKSAYRYLLKTERLYHFEKLLLRFFKRDMPKIHNDVTLKRALKKLYSELEKLQEDPYEKKGLSQCELLAWLESRIKGRSLSQVLCNN